MRNKFNPDIHHRRSIRLKNYDYRQQGAYFVTVCAWNRECLFGDVLDGDMQLNEFGRIVKNEWLQTGVVRPIVELDAFVVMPNHFHGIIILADNVGAIRRIARIQNGTIHQNGATRRAAQDRAIHRIAPTTLQSNSIGAIVGQFKSIITKQINRIRNSSGSPVWQRNYYEHIIRNEDELNRIREYIISNPLRWADDENNPKNVKT